MFLAELFAMPTIISDCGASGGDFMFLDALLDSLLDSLKLLPFLLLTYLLMEYLEHKASKKTEELVKQIKDKELAKKILDNL